MEPNNNNLTIPILDFREYYKQETRQCFLDRLREVLINVGFFYLVGHGCSPQICDDVINIARKFFDLPSSSKMRMHMDNSRHFRGYVGLGEEITNYKKDNREQIYFSSELEVPKDYVHGESEPFLGIIGPNQWPLESEVPGFKEKVLRYQSECNRISQELMSAIAGSLDLDPDYFRSTFEHNPCKDMVMARYPTVTHHNNEFGVGPHKDYGYLTLLLQDNVGGLQVQAQNGEWIDATPIPGSFVINIGQSFERMTQQVYVATTHRVLNNTSGRDRISTPFFLCPSLMSKIEVIPLSDQILSQRRKVVTDVKDHQLLQQSMYGINQYNGMKRSFVKTWEKYYKELEDKMTTSVNP
ncbi:hypothetical protein SAMD00019534_051300, partial [Acytostelium subglobosum LB1]|uniref:hypothetical protein n=1 Tax=Acytostelium subglobosum LB1 TaxID=1410327 RepID=UPI000644BA10